MWVMILMTNWFGHHDYNGSTATPVSVTSIEFSSRERCLAASKFLRANNKKVYSVNCVKK